MFWTLYDDTFTNGTFKFVNKFSIDIESQPSSHASKGRPLAIQPSVKLNVVDVYGVKRLPEFEYNVEAIVKDYNESTSVVIDNVVTTVNGVGQFEILKFKDALPGSYRLQFRVAGVTWDYSIESSRIDLVTAADAIVFTNRPQSYSSTYTGTKV